MTKVNAKVFSLVFIVIMIASSIALASDVEVVGSSDVALNVLNTSTADYASGISGAAMQASYAGYGIGGQFGGGGVGVLAAAGGDTCTPWRYGVVALASNSTDGNVGILSMAAAPSLAGFFLGDVLVLGNFYNLSDERLKSDVEDMDGALYQVMELKPKKFKYRVKENPELNLPSGSHMGLVAQDVEQTLPDLIGQAKAPDINSKGQRIDNKNKSFLTVDYVEMIPLLIKAIQEQQEQIADLQSQVATLTGKKDK